MARAPAIAAVLALGVFAVEAGVPGRASAQAASATFAPGLIPSGARPLAPPSANLDQRFPDPRPMTAVRPGTIPLAQEEGGGAGAGEGAASPSPAPKAGPGARRGRGTIHTAVTIEQGTGQVINLGRTLSNLFAADPKVAEVRPASPTSVFVFGVAPGRTTVAALDENGATVAIWEVTVRPSAYGANEADALIRRQVPGANVRIDVQQNGYVLSGSVATPGDSDHVLALLRGAMPDKLLLENRLAIRQPIQVMLRVRIAEVSRDVTRQLGIRWNALGQIGKFAIGGGLADPLGVASTVQPNSLATSYIAGNLNLSSAIDLLAQDNLATVLAEPTLTAISGEPASFLVGGEFPIPVAQQNNTISIEFKQYGISLAFVPTVLEPGRISLHVRPEVSDLSNANSISVSATATTANLVIPSLIVRRADTTVELGSGQSFAMAGLLSGTNTQTVAGLPGLGDLPILGALFRSDRFVRNETELVILVTPYIVRPVGDPSQLRTPLDRYLPPDDSERVFLGRQQGIEARTPKTGRIPDYAGFILR